MRYLVCVKASDFFVYTSLDFTDRENRATNQIVKEDTKNKIKTNKKV